MEAMILYFLDIKNNTLKIFFWSIILKIGPNTQSQL